MEGLVKVGFIDKATGRYYAEQTISQTHQETKGEKSNQ